MDDAIYVALNRQRGLAVEMDRIANNIANISTLGYQREGTVFSEFIARSGRAASLSMGDIGARFYDTDFGAFETTGGTFDVAIEGPGYFLIGTEAGERLTRAGAFLASPEGELVTSAGDRVLDEGGAPIAIPPDAGSIAIAPDGTISADGTIVGRIAVVEADPATLTREGNVLFVPNAGYTPAGETALRQGARESSNVNPVGEIARMIEVQRAYERSHALLEGEDERISGAIRALGREA